MTKEITIFAKKRTTKDGKKSFYSYLTTLENKAGESVTMSVKFPEDVKAPDPASCPCNIIVEKEDCNISKKTFTREDTGEDAVSNTLWIKNYVPGSEYVDHSTDDYFI